MFFSIKSLHIPLVLPLVLFVPAPYWVKQLAFCSLSMLGQIIRIESVLSR